MGCPASQWLTQIDHLRQAITEKVIGHGAAFKNFQKTGSIEYLFESSDYLDSPHITSIHVVCRGFAGPTKYLFESSDQLDSLQITNIHAGCRVYAGTTV